MRLARNHSGPIMPLVLVLPDGLVRWLCLECLRPASPDARGNWRHYARHAWRPRAG